jgi:two-component system osmolarity sensor histidine kinase EnvZ
MGLKHWLASLPIRLRLRDFTPRGLLPRSFLIVALPIALLQVAVSYAFFDQHWRDASRRLSDGVAGDIAFLMRLYERNPDPEWLETMGRDAWATTRLSVALREGETLPTSERRSVFRALDQTLGRALSNAVEQPFWFDTTRYPDFIDIRVQVTGGVLRLLAYRERTFITNGHIFLLWSIGATALLMAVALAFLRNQIKPILRLTAAADAIGRGVDPPAAFRATGAREIRQAAESMLEMRDRLVRFTEQRSALLASVSHDLRTPLTRLKLALALMPPSEDITDARRDLDEMQAMLDGYLAFARGAEAESPELLDLVALLPEAARASDGKPGTLTLNLPVGPVEVEARPLALRRALGNLIGNAADYAPQTRVHLEQTETDVLIHVDDDGPGIPVDQREAAFRPFNRLDAARNQNTGGVGLGLAIARDVARAHGGDVRLETSPQGGLRASFVLRRPRPL